MSQLEHTQLQVVLEEICELLERGQKYHAQKAQEYGEPKDLFLGFKDLTHKVNEEAFSPFTASFDAYRAFLRAQKNNQLQVSIGSTGFANVSSAAAFSTTPMIPAVQKFADTYLKPPKSMTSVSSEIYASRLEKLDAELGRMYRGIAEVFWGSTQNPERTALGLTRQVFDHLFSVLAPDDKVRDSAHFTPKTNGDEKAVQRIERIRYAAYTRIKDRAQADFLAEQAAGLLNAYGELNRLHVRDGIDRSQATQILQAMLVFLQQWIDALAL